jgi:hypothetical protein
MDGERPVDDWTPPLDVYVVPIMLGAPADRHDGRWFRVADLADLSTGQLDRILGDLERERGYRDGQSLGGGLSLFLGAVATSVALRAFENRAIPVLPPEETWLRDRPPLVRSVTAKRSSSMPGSPTPRGRRDLRDGSPCSRAAARVREAKGR